mmetsp:Transcript_7110/g.20785  ORF Transcript_7110/g.20785 Transcript_7110/m.20785 type:complete len:207 (-) Transcript_7110:457-1077(-)
MLITKDCFDLEKQFTFYASYHNDKVNQIIHFICIWPILWTGMVFFAGTVPIMEVPEAAADFLAPATDRGAELDWCFVLAAYYAIYYILLEKNLAGFTGAALVIASWVTASWFQKEGGALFDMTSWKAALNGHVAAWTLQFLGHGIWEKRTPALMDNPSQAFLMAPMFVLLEFFFLFGYRPALYSSAMAQVEKNVAAFKASKAKKGN